MKKIRLPRREREICGRLRSARDWLGLSQLACADQMAIERGSLANYESGRTSLKHEIALRFCHQMIVSEEWLATGKVDSMRAEASRHNVKLTGNDPALDEIFGRQCMDLITEPICRRIPANLLFGEAFDQYLAPRYRELAREFFYVPRIIYSESDPTSRNLNIIQSYSERWLLLLGNEALRRHKSPARVKIDFTRAFLKIGGELFKKYHQSGLDPGALNAAFALLEQPTPA
jgi:transcriptional regulator with XRE-family HTH domain